MVLLVPLTPSASEAIQGLSPSVPQSPVKTAKSQQAKDSIEVREISFKGKGIFATRDIACGEVIFREKPLIVMPQKIFDDDDPTYIELWLDRRINRMTAEEREMFYSLADSRFSDGDNKSTLGIFYTNDMTFTDDSAALFPTLARVNHSCGPNADFVARDSLGVQDLVAVRPIKRDEEVSICYLPSSGAGSDLKEVRQEYTRTWYGFQCNCHVCTLQGTSLKSDEYFRKKVKRYQEMAFEELSKEQVEDFIDALQKVQVKLPYLIEVLKKCLEKCVSLGEKQLFGKYSTMAFTAAEIVCQYDDIEDSNPFLPTIRSEIVTFGSSQSSVYRRINLDSVF